MWVWEDSITKLNQGVDSCGIQYPNMVEIVKEFCGIVGIQQ
jgi:hypothetical protein